MKKKKPILLIGAGGHANSCVEVIERSNNFYIAGFISSKHSINDKMSLGIALEKSNAAGQAPQGSCANISFFS